MQSLVARPLSCGAYLPEKVVSNEDLCRLVETSHEWILQRTGIHQRHFAAAGEKTSDLGAQAALAALKSAGVAPQEVDALIVATATPDETFPSTATIIQYKIGMTGGFAFDVAAVCTGFITALGLANNFIRMAQARTVLVIGAETFSRILDMGDRRTCVLFGDGAGALLLRAEQGEPSKKTPGVLGVTLASDGRYHDSLYADGGPSSTQTSGYVRMEGQEVFRHAVVKLAESAESILRAHEISKEDVSWLIPHQANIRIIESLAKRLEIPWEKVVHTVDRHANTSAASIPLALEAAWSEGKLRPGDLVLHDAIGAGLIWGSALVRW